MDDPDLDRVFTEAWHETMDHADRFEHEKRFADHAKAFTELFERELEGRDLSESERGALVTAFERRIAEAERMKEVRRVERSRRRNRIVTAAAGTVAIVILGLLVTFRPLKPIDEVHERLDTYLSGVESGVGGYADDFYKLLDRYRLRIDDGVEEMYRERMYDALDRRFADLLEGLASGNLMLLDDAKRWADLFPERAERRARKEVVANTAAQGVGGAVRGIIDRLKRAGDDAAQWVESVIERQNGSAQETSGDAE